MLRYDELVDIGLQRIPEFKNAFNDLCKRNILDRGCGVHIIYGIAFVTVLLHAFETNDEELLKKMFAFMEEMVKSPDKEVGAVCDFSILEAINGEVSEEELYRYMGPETRQDLDYMRFEIGYLA